MAKPYMTTRLYQDSKLLVGHGDVYALASHPGYFRSNHLILYLINQITYPERAQVSGLYDTAQEPPERMPIDGDEVPAPALRA